MAEESVTIMLELEADGDVPEAAAAITKQDLRTLRPAELLFRVVGTEGIHWTMLKSWLGLMFAMHGSRQQRVYAESLLDSLTEEHTEYDSSSSGEDGGGEGVEGGSEYEEDGYSRTHFTAQLMAS